MRGERTTLSQFIQSHTTDVDNKALEKHYEERRKRNRDSFQRLSMVSSKKH